MTTPLWIVIPAAGVGKRMGRDVPKQYLELRGKPIIAHAIERLAGFPGVQGVMVAISETDAYWNDVSMTLDVPLWTATGGVERCHSVLNALTDLGLHAREDDWVLVHDAARPCVRSTDLEKLVGTLKDDTVGGLLAMPVRDTMKRAGDDGRVVTTEPREGLWHALTPQMFRLGMLRHALEEAIEAEELVTDESAAIERAGHRPRLVEGHGDNLKITRPEDLALAEFFLQRQAEEA